MFTYCINDTNNRSHNNVFKQVYNNQKILNQHLIIKYTIIRLIQNNYSNHLFKMFRKHYK